MKKFGFNKQEVNLSALTEEPSEYELILLGIAERDWQTKEARVTDNASKKAVQAVLEKHEAELLRPMGSEARKRVPVSNNTDDGFSLATYCYDWGYPICGCRRCQS